MHIRGRVWCLPGEWIGKLFSVMLLVHRLLSSGPEELVIDTWTHWPYRSITAYTSEKERERERWSTESSHETITSKSTYSWVISDFWLFTWWQTGAGHTLVYAIDVIVEVAAGWAHHADPWAGGQRVKVTTVVVAHRVAVLHDGRSTVKKTKTREGFELWLRF